jgi:hypothetical protein
VRRFLTPGTLRIRDSSFAFSTEMFINDIGGVNYWGVVGGVVGGGGERNMENYEWCVWYELFASRVLYMWPGLECLAYVELDLGNGWCFFFVWINYTGSRYFSILHRGLKRRQFSASHYNVPLLVHVCNFVWNAGRNDGDLYSVRCFAYTVFVHEINMW